MVLGAGAQKRAVFVDRDGTINVEKDYLYRIEDFEFIPGAPEAIRRLNEAGFLVVVVTNQSGVARGYYTEEDVEILHRHIAAELGKAGARVDAWYYCPHHPAGRGSYALPCRCRKPLPGMLMEAACRHNIDLAASVMIGDKLADMKAGIAAGCRTILVRSGYGASEEARVLSGTSVYDDLLAAVLSLVPTCG
ncbi:D-glycero-beta-D-manno-heptose 1,7-bisphosphate 7-phosphatase [Oryzomonas sagensis]|uniref:D,D-heptose 1,7-bisphosphate phosphatase n=1 Tax=Oryzomonas sagensis TaxID=2603857 RepID=A0ABQ6TM99_9BACT|nr:D-glycero-beta-D-manno-heptose 1,7-bisphosphate 7-phosphatase [Oryzomonas sagensis]KAB0669508.1 D-glycero-beta-D-manno-heptose 1,7-bisphosphate 7-phosphatase [Oryzomonas sagensis]